ncbi:AAA-ATPase At3g28580-like isoform X2 [Panicum virgatum]|uniref:AAA-ATPase At3g28580-like isoform X2 n=1 Tax=Panicum virgatum TaxID=38727 RepID=UPI0019D6474D|nr:AAA-ATPase At3g28580-like isoform X2 [Panicum virgatum]
MALSVEKWVGFGSAMAGFGLLWSRMPEHVHDEARYIISSLVPMVMSYFNPYEQITISEYGQERIGRNKLFDAVSTYLRRACLDHASKLKAELRNNSKYDDPLISLDENQEVVDNFEGVRMWWRLCPKSAKNKGGTVISLFTGDSDEPRCYRLVFLKRHRTLVVDSYLPSVVREWHELIATNRQRLLFTNHSRDGKSHWIRVPYNPPAKFDMLAMDHSKKVEIMEDLTAFREAKEYHSKVGKAWKRGYLLHGPPGTGKSTMIGAMANFLEYDVYDLDLTSIKDNAELRKLFLDTTDRSIIVIEDIDAIEVELTTKRESKEAAEEKDDNHQVTIELSDKNKDKGKVTLSGLLSFVDGLWSACGTERIFVFTTNHVDRLDPALIRRGRMDRHIEMSYCRFEGFKMLAKSYITEHSLFGEIGQLLDEIDTTPADVAGSLMPRVKRRREADDCLARLVETLKKAKMKSAAPAMDSVEEAKED